MYVYLCIYLCVSLCISVGMNLCVNVGRFVSMHTAIHDWVHVKIVCICFPLYAHLYMCICACRCKEPNSKTSLNRPTVGLTLNGQCLGGGQLRELTYNFTGIDSIGNHLRPK